MLASEEAFREVRRVLTHLYDAVYLQCSPLVGPLRAHDPLMVAGREASRMRQILLEAIEGLAPGDNVPLRSQERRSYLALRQHYVEQMPVERVADALALSERQVRRELRAGLEAVTAVITGKLRQEEIALEGSVEAEVPSEDILSELDELGPLHGAVNLCAEVRSIEALVASLASDCGVELQDEHLPESVIVRADRVVLRQVLLAVYSWAIQNCAHGRVARRVYSVTGQEMVFELSLKNPGRRRLPAQRPGEIVSADLLNALRTELSCRESAAGELALGLALPPMPLYSVLLVDDNPSIHKLFRRYLSGLPYALHSAHDVSSAMETARSVRPDVAILDIMMPHRDGWELIAALRSDALTCDIPVVVCSVLEQEALARSLDVRAYMRKPVMQSTLLSTLHRLGLGNPTG